MGQAIFYNMTSMDVTLQVNHSAQEPISGLPASSPYLPNYSKGTYDRNDTDQPRVNEFGNTNTVYYQLGQGGSGGTVTVTIDVNFQYYTQDKDILVYLFEHAVVASTARVDNNAYFGHSGDTINMDPTVKAAQL